MSAFMVSKSHIDALVRTALHGPDGIPRHHWIKPVFDDSQTWGYESTDRLGEELISANRSSIHYRYPDTVENPEATPGPIEQYWNRPYHLRESCLHPTLNIVEALKAIDCFEYQACEYPEWENSAAYDFCESFRYCLIRCLPGYDAAKWEVAEAES